MWRIIKLTAKTGIRTETPPTEDDLTNPEAQHIQQELLAILGRALAIRAVDAGSCNGCELEIHALNNPCYNIEGIGIKFVASPRHADLLLVTLELADGSGDPRIVRCHCHDPSWQNWPALEHAVIGNIVPDFPLINKSFNLSYSGHDI